MKVAVLIVAMSMMFIAMFGDIGAFSQLDSGFVAGKMAIHAKGDTIMYVTRDVNGSVVLYRSVNGGADWIVNSGIIPATFDNNVIPTLSVSNQDCIITAGKYYVKSSDGGIIWQPPILWNGSFENSPYIEQRGNDLKLFDLSLPYPQNDQYDYLIPGTTEYAVPQVFLNEQRNFYNGNMHFSGADVISGPVRVNGDMYIRQTGQGANNGFPTFLAPVVVSGQVICNTGVYPVDTVFRGGLITNAPQLDMPDTSSLRQSGSLVGPSSYSPDRIVMITVDGNSYTAMLGTISAPRRVTINVWPDYPLHPFEIESDPAFINTFTTRDTLWSPLPGGSCGNRFVFVNSKLWIKGQFSGHQTWCAADTIMIIGDITLSNTTPGTSPYPDNTEDSVNLVSERSIMLKYGYRDPVTNERVHPLCRSDQDPIYIYASLYALGDGYGNSIKDGVFSFEYQHPHGSIEPREISLPGGGTELLDKIDLHRNRYPQTLSAPWPALLDYPWYNPLYPEQAPYLERGSVMLWGSIVQRRAGFLHRSYYDVNYPSNGVWNPSQGFYGGSSAPTSFPITLMQNPPQSVTLQTRNFPGALGAGVGYKKNHFADPRNTLAPAEEYFETGLWRFGLIVRKLDSYLYDWPYIKRLYKPITGKSYHRKANVALYSANDLLLIERNDLVTDISQSTINDGTIVSTAIKNNHEPVVYQLKEEPSGLNMVLKYLSATNGEVQEQLVIPVISQMNDIAVLGTNLLMMAKYESDGRISLLALNNNLQPTLLETWQPQPPIAFNANNRLYMVPSGDNSIELFVMVYPNQPQWLVTTPGTLYHARVTYGVSNSDPTAPAMPALSLTAFPNPTRGDLHLSIKHSGSTPHHVEIYNLKGQKLRSLSGAVKNADGELTYLWDGLDEQGKTTASGIYLVKLIVDNKRVLSKRICRY